LDERGVIVGVEANHEKRGGDTAGFQNIQDAGSELRIRPVVEGEAEDFADGRVVA
jgi:hypothetical protein